MQLEQPTQIKPLGDFVLVEQVQQAQATRSGLVLPEQTERQNVYCVVAAGPKSGLKPGDHVMLSKEVRVRPEITDASVGVNAMMMVRKDYIMAKLDHPKRIVAAV